MPTRSDSRPIAKCRYCREQHRSEFVVFQLDQERALRFCSSGCMLAYYEHGDSWEFGNDLMYGDDGLGDD